MFSDFNLIMFPDRPHHPPRIGREQTLANDAAYLVRYFPHLFLWVDWWSTSSGTPGNPCAGHSKFPVGSPTGREWQKMEAGTVAS